MFQLFKDRNFNDYINDTFQFFRVLGKHYFKNFFIINGGLLLLSVVLIYFFSKVYFDFVFSKLSGGIAGSQQNNLDTYFSNNIGLIITLVIVGIVFFMIVSLIQFAFPVVYLDLYDKNKGTNFMPKDILNGLKSRIPKLLKFTFGSIFVIFPVFIITIVVLVLLCFVIIGIPLFFITMPALVSWINLSFYYYMNSDEGFFSAIGDGFDTVKQQFWPIVGSTAIMYIIIQIVNTIFTMVPYIFGMASIFTTLSESGNSADKFSGFSSMMVIVMVVSVIVSFILINQGMIYYSHIENEENTVSKNAIDLIGTDSE
jgi:hypothetical protein